MNIQSVNWTINHVKELDTLGLIDYSPEFQRNYVWSEKQKVYLLDSILNCFAIPKIFVRQILDEGQISNKYEIIDGQQRLTTILKFIKNEFSLQKKRHPKPEFFDSQFEGKYFSDLSVDNKKQILNFTLSVDLVEGNYKEITEMFLRLNLSNTSLNKQEILNSQYFGDFKSLIVELANDYLDDFVECKIISASGAKRMQDAHFVGQCIMAQMFGIIDKSKKVEETYKNYDDWDKDEIEKNRTEFSKIYKLITQFIFSNEISSTPFKSLNGYISLHEFFHTMIYKQNKSLNKSNYENVRKSLEWLATEINAEGYGEGKKWYDTTMQGGDTSQSRHKRREILNNLLEGFFNQKDSRRSFNDKERIIAWNSNEKKICGICNDVIIGFDDYDLDHVIPYEKGGVTSLLNSQLTHIKCNRSKGMNG
jgi:hypothetical protein